ncbi:MAG: hypothetical protein JRF20_03405 [Deltaproteobacteria bacterium]|nr:hypothetical protein [Deltaproteobacteria bacterium]
MILASYLDLGLPDDKPGGYFRQDRKTLSYFLHRLCEKKLTLFLNERIPSTFRARLTCLRGTSQSFLPFGAAGTEDKDRPVSRADDMTNFSASSVSKPEPYIVYKGGNNGDI